MQTYREKQLDFNKIIGLILLAPTFQLSHKFQNIENFLGHDIVHESI